jgi:hypothetical protein
MKRGISIIGGILLAASMSSPVFAAGHKHGGGGGESQAGGLPGLEDRVEADELLIATIQGQIVILQGQIAALQGQNNWAVVAANGTVARSNPAAGITVEHTALSGVYEVTFTKNVSGCAYEATIGDTATAVPTQGEISVSGDVNGDNPDDVYVQTFNTSGVATDSPFHLFVSCP